MTQYGKKMLNLVTRLGCLLSIAGPFLAILLYPRAKWLFALVLIGIAIVVLSVRLRRDPTPAALADEIENLLTGTTTDTLLMPLSTAGFEIRSFASIGTKA
jgi:hypothetical protein